MIAARKNVVSHLVDQVVSIWAPSLTKVLLWMSSMIYGPWMAYRRRVMGDYKTRRKKEVGLSCGLKLGWTTCDEAIDGRQKYMRVCIMRHQNLGTHHTTRIWKRPRFPAQALWRICNIYSPIESPVDINGIGNRITFFSRKQAAVYKWHN